MFIESLLDSPLETIVMDRCRIRNDFCYWKDKTWARIKAGERIVRIGLDDFAQGNAGKIRFVSTKPKGSYVAQGKTFAMIEAFKWVGPLKSPLSGIIVETNPNLKKKPFLLNEAPYDGGWIVDIDPSDLGNERKTLYSGSASLNWIRQEIKEINENLSRT